MLRRWKYWLPSRSVPEILTCIAPQRHTCGGCQLAAIIRTVSDAKAGARKRQRVQRRPVQRIPNPDRFVPTGGGHLTTIGINADTAHLMVVAHLQEPAACVAIERPRIPHANGSIGSAGGQSLTIGANSHALTITGVSLER